MTNSDIRSIIESKKPPNEVILSVNRAIAPSTPSKIPVKNTKIENKIRFKNTDKEKKLKKAKNSMIIVAILGVTPNLLKPLAINLTKGANKYLKRNFDGIFSNNSFLTNFKHILTTSISFKIENIILF